MNAPSLVPSYPLACRPPIWARGGHLQTIFGHLLPARAERIDGHPEYRRCEVELGDGERLVGFASPGTSGLRVHLFHGLTGDVDADYMRTSASALRQRGHGVWAFNHRGCGAGAGHAYKPYHSGSSADIARVLLQSRRDEPRQIQIAIGFSLSGNAALRLACESTEALPDGIVAVNPPVDIARTSHTLGRGRCRLYERRFLRRLRRDVHRRVRAGKTSQDYSIPRNASLCQFDDLFTAPEGGFRDGADYYRTCSTVGRLDEVRVPSVILTSADDPFAPVDVYRDRKRSPLVQLHIEPTGGHVGYLMRDGWGWQRWLSGALVHYVEALAARRRSI